MFIKSQDSPVIMPGKNKVCSHSKYTSPYFGLWARSTEIPSPEGFPINSLISCLSGYGEKRLPIIFFRKLQSVKGKLCSSDIHAHMLIMKKAHAGIGKHMLISKIFCGRIRVQQHFILMVSKSIKKQGFCLPVCTKIR